MIPWRSGSRVRLTRGVDAASTTELRRLPAGSMGRVIAVDGTSRNEVQFDDFPLPVIVPVGFLAVAIEVVAGKLRMVA